jgi:hypothetical protein
VILTIRMPAPWQSVFEPDAFDNMVGQEVPMSVGVPEIGNGHRTTRTAVVRSATVAEDGRSVELEVEVEES